MNRFFLISHNFQKFHSSKNISAHAKEYKRNFGSRSLCFHPLWCLHTHTPPPRHLGLALKLVKFSWLQSNTPADHPLLWVSLGPFFNQNCRDQFSFSHDVCDLYVWFPNTCGPRALSVVPRYTIRWSKVVIFDLVSSAKCIKTIKRFMTCRYYIYDRDPQLTC